MRAIVFDYFGTLSDPAGEAERRRSFAGTAQALGIDADTFWAAMSGSFRERITGVHGDTRSTMLAMARRCGVEPAPDQLDAAVTAQLAGARGVQRARPGALATLTALRDRGFRLALMSDCSSELVELWPHNAFAPVIQASVFSWSERRHKPHPELYATAAARLGVPPEECWYVGDGGNRELGGAHGAGMRPVLVTNRAHPEAAGHRTDPDDHLPDHTVDDLPELLGICGSPDALLSRPDHGYCADLGPRSAQ